jgi:hypothetical protein
VRRVEISSEHRYRFPAPPEAVWAGFAEVDRYPGWWPWLRSFDGRALAPGDSWACTIRPPLPYAIRCTISLAVVDHPRLVTARVTGDITGGARLSLSPAEVANPGPATDVVIASTLAATSLAARVGARALPRLARWGHDWVLDTAARQFADAHGWRLGPPDAAFSGRR